MKSIRELMQWRFACQSFDTKKKIADDSLDDILELTSMAPSSFGLQPWKFIVIKDKKIRQKLIPICDNQKQIAEASALIICCVRTDLSGKNGLVERYIDTYKKVRGKTEKDLLKFRENLHKFLAAKKPAARKIWLQRQIYIAAETMMMASAEKGYDTCPIEGFNDRELSKKLSLPKYMKPVLLMCIGFRTVNPAPKVRFPLGEIVEFKN